MVGIRLFLRSLFWTILCPGTVTLLIPFLFFTHSRQVNQVEHWQQGFGLVIGLLGASVLIWCIYAFARDGEGTLSPADPARNLVVRGLYQYVRNPMYLGVVAVLVGESLFFGSLPLAGYTLAVFIVFNAFIRWHEEPYLRKKFGAAYLEYCKKAGRWLPKT